MSQRPFVINTEPLLIGEILQRNHAREVVAPRLGIIFRRRRKSKTHVARISDREVVESNLPLPNAMRDPRCE